jgi:hypothetical protein
MPLMLTDAQMDLLTQLSLPIDVDRRPAFLQAVSLELENAAGIGEGAVYRIGARLQRQFWQPPEVSPNASAPQHHRVKVRA